MDEGIHDRLEESLASRSHKDHRHVIDPRAEGLPEVEPRQRSDHAACRRKDHDHGVPNEPLRLPQLDSGRRGNLQRRGVLRPRGCSGGVFRRHLGEHLEALPGRLGQGNLLTIDPGLEVCPAFRVVAGSRHDPDAMLSSE